MKVMMVLSLVIHILNSNGELNVAKELHCVQCKKFMGTIRDGNISKGLQPVCTKCFNFMTKAAGNWAQHNIKKDKRNRNTKLLVIYLVVVVMICLMGYLVVRSNV